ncbi:gamma-tubulin complex component 5 [Fopius arisanus]|uniref:Gamma-tubulin complex component n=1 Tax=Fopius arisanus TaxID=64838 RepID=A0A9R1SWA6_9HYME|nr:PREDICTED: gamma-tubulin complex component 5 [Fopius arisanus]
MGSKILNDIQNDLKLLITSLTGFEEADEGYQLCERYVFSNMKHHRFLSINSHAVKRTINEVEEKFQIYGKYNVAREFKSLVDNFLTSFDFEQHPQYDLQWSLLCLLLNLSRDTTKSEIDCLHTTKVEKTLTSSFLEEVDEIDWGEHLKEGQENFFSNYASSSDSEWSDDENEKVSTPLTNTEKPVKLLNESSGIALLEPPHLLQTPKTPSVFQLAIESRDWLDSNVENTWWNTLNSYELKPRSNFPQAYLCKMFRRLEKISPFVLPFRKVLEGVVDEILDRRYSCATKLVKDILINEYKLENHLRLMRFVFMMERGHVMKRFYQKMFSDIEGNVSVSNPESLTHLLEEVLSDEWRDSNSHNRWFVSLRDTCTRQVLQAIDHIVLNYDVDWPINMVLTKEALRKYNCIFRFALKLKWALWSLNNLRFSDLEGQNSANMNDMLHHFHTRRLESLRFWLLHAIGSIHAYLCGQVLQSLGLILEQELTLADSLDAIIEAHNDYLEKVYEHCLQTPQFSDIMVTINNLLGMCVHVRDRWQRGAKQLIAAELDLMESSFTKYHTYLALALHNAVQHKEADYCKSATSVSNLRYLFQSNIPHFDDYTDNIH